MPPTTTAEGVQTEYMNNSTTNDANLPMDDAPLSSEECERLKKCIRMAYPAPETNIREGVMQEIDAESRRRQRMNRFVRYGSVAACFVLLIGVIFTIIPVINRTTAKNDAAEAYVMTNAANGTGAPAAPRLLTDTVTEDAAEECVKSEEDVHAKSYTYSTAYQGVLTADSVHSTTAECEGAVEESPLTDDAAPAEASADVSMESGAAAPAAAAERKAAEAVCRDADLPEDYAFDTSLPSSDARYGLTCPVHGIDSLHIFCDGLIAYVGEEAFAVWQTTEEAADECGVPSVRRLAEQFGIDRDTFAEITADSGIAYSLDRIYPNEN